MSEAKHTPGPWAVRRVDAHHPTQLVYCQIIPALDAGKKNALAYAGVYGKSRDGKGTGEPGQDEAECSANARLIAAAPELLAVCQAALSYIASDKCTLHGIALYNELDAAIAKATPAASAAKGEGNV